MTGLLNASSWSHIFRSFLHTSLFIVGLFYTVSIPYFLNADVWVYIYGLSGFFLFVDAVIVLQNKNFQAWPILYALDALFVALVIYKTGHVFFNIFMCAWLLHILFVGIQYDWKGVLLQGLWTSILWTWVQILSMHFHPFDWNFFAFHSFLILGTSTWWSIMSSYKSEIYSFLNPVFSKIKYYMSILFQPLVSEDWDIIKDKSLNNLKLERIDMDLLMSEVVDCCHKKAQFSLIQYSSSVTSSVLGYKNQIKQMIMYIVQWFVCHYSNPYQKINIQIFNKEDWLVIEFKKSGDLEVQKPIPLLHWVQSTMFVQKSIENHNGELKIQGQSIQIYLPLLEKTDQQGKLSG